MVPGLATIVCVGLDYHTLRLPPEIATYPGRGRISNYAWQLDYHYLMTPRLEELGHWWAGEARSPVQLWGLCGHGGHSGTGSR